jgi:hypothetical protein
MGYVHNNHKCVAYDAYSKVAPHLITNCIQIRMLSQVPFGIHVSTYVVASFPQRCILSNVEAT